MAPAQQLRLALFSGNYNNVRDGANRALNRLTAYLLSRNVAVKVFSPTIQAPAFEPAGDLYSLPSIPLPGRSEYRLAYRFGRETKRTLDAFAPHIVHLSVPDVMGHAAKRYARRKGIPVVASFHTRFETYLDYYHLGLLEPAVHHILRKFYNDCAHVYVPSPSVEESLRSIGVVAPVRRWTRGIDCSVFSPEKRSEDWRIQRGLDPNTPILLFVGRLVREKGLGVLIETSKALEAAGGPVQIVIVGTGPEEAALKQALPSAHLTGHLERADLTQAYANGDIFFNPSDTESFGNVTLEAMASGLACICSNAGGSANIVEHGRNGFLATARDAQDHIRHTQTLLNDPTLRQSFGVQSREMSLGRSWDAVMAELFEHYKDLLGASYRAVQFDCA